MATDRLGFKLNRKSSWMCNCL